MAVVIGTVIEWWAGKNTYMYIHLKCAKAHVTQMTLFVRNMFMMASKRIMMMHEYTYQSHGFPCH